MNYSPPFRHIPCPAILFRHNIRQRLYHSLPTPYKLIHRSAGQTVFPAEEERYEFFVIRKLLLKKAA